MNEFMKHEASNETYWRSIILFGRNVATYKFALAASLLDFAKQGQQTVSISELARPFAAHIVEHIKVQPKQGTSGSSKFLDACMQYTQHKLSLDQLHEATVRLGFVNVIDAFHVVGSDLIPKRFYLDERGTNNGIRITEEFSSLLKKLKQIMKMTSN